MCKYNFSVGTLKNHFTEAKLYSTWNSNLHVLKMLFFYKNQKWLPEMAPRNGSLKWVVVLKKNVKINTNRNKKEIF